MSTSTKSWMWAAAAAVVLAVVAWRALRPAGTERASVVDAREASDGVTTSMPRSAAPPESERAPRSGAPDAAPAEASVIALRVLDGEGSPVPAAEIEAWTEGDEDAVERYLADARGELRLKTTLPIERLRLEARSVGRGTSSVVDLRTVPPAPDGTHVLRLHPLARVIGSVQGTDGQPVSGALVSASFPGTMIGSGTPRDVGPVRTDAEGRFELELPAAGVFRFVAERFGARSKEVEVAPNASRETELLLRFGGKGLVSAVVLAPDGTPADDATVHLWEIGVPHPTRLQESTDGAGEVALELAHGGEFGLIATSGQHASSEPLWLSLEQDEDRTDLVLRLAPATAIAGRVIDAEGRPVSGVFVGAVPDDHDPQREPTPGGVRSDWYDGFAQTTTDAQGRFRLEPLRPDRGRFVLMCAADPARPDRILRERGVLAGAQDVELVLTEARLRGGFVHGLVTREGGEELPDRIVAELVERRPDGEWRSLQPRELTTENGEYLLEGLEPGLEYTLCVYQGVGGLRVFTETFLASLEGTRLDVELPEPRPVELRVSPGTTLEPIPKWIAIETVVPHPAGSPALAIPLDRDGVAHVPIPPGTWLARREGNARDEREPLEFRVRPVEGLQVVRFD